MTYKALTKEEYDSFVKVISGSVDEHASTLLNIIIELSIEHSVSVRSMIDLCIAEMIIITHTTTDTIKVKTILSTTFIEHGITQKHIMLSINGESTRILIDSQIETIVKIGNVKKLCFGLIQIHSDCHNSVLKEFSIKNEEQKS